jgi:hypothetical protein
MCIFIASLTVVGLGATALAGDEPAPLWSTGLPSAIGPLPTGLANASAQGCHACHDDAHTQWAGSAHHGVSSQFREATEHETPACTFCHLPLDVQRPAITTFEPGQPNRWSDQPNPSYDATLASEGVTCAACHLRNGSIVATQETAAPHPIAVNPELKAVSTCAPCHQLDWPGSPRPLYDTVGEWTRSDWSKAGVTCVDCHQSSGHGGGADPARAVSLLVQVAPTLVRGQPPTKVEITLQNTGAGHAFPTGTPFRGVRLEATLRGPGAKKGEIRGWGTSLVVDLDQEFTKSSLDSSTWVLGADHRIPAGGSRSWTWELALPAEAASGKTAIPVGPWTVEVTLTRTRNRRPISPPFVVQSYPIRVQ